MLEGSIYDPTSVQHGPPEAELPGRYIGLRVAKPTDTRHRRDKAAAIAGGLLNRSRASIFLGAQDIADVRSDFVRSAPQPRRNSEATRQDRRDAPFGAASARNKKIFTPFLHFAQV
jgi:hypothetical protein